MAFGKYFKSMEDASTTEDVTLAIDPQEEVIAAGGDTAGDVLEVQERIAQIESGEDAIDSAIDETEVVEEHIENAEASLAEGGMDQTAATSLDIATESFARKMSIKRNKPTGMAIEAFGGTSTRLRATKLAIEEDKSLVTKAWEKILSWIASIKKFIVETWQKMTSFYDRTRLRAEKISEKSQKADVETKKEVTKAGLAARVSIGDKADAQAIAASFLQTRTTAVTLITSFTDTLGKEIDFSKDATASVAILEKIGAAISAVPGSESLSANDYDAPEGATVKRIGQVLPGNKQVILTTKDDKEDPVFKVTVTDVAKVTENTAEKLPGLSKEEIKKICDSIRNLSANARDFEKQINALSKTGDTLINKIKNVTKKDEGSAAVRKNVTKLVGSMGSPAVKYLGTAVKSASAVLDWCNASMGGKEETKETTAETK